MSMPLLLQVERKDLRSPLRKAVMMFCALRADDDGTRIFASKETMAQATGYHRRSVIRVFAELVAEGLLRPTGTRPCANGRTIEYRLDLEAIDALNTLPAFQKRERRPVTESHPSVDNPADQTPPAEAPSVDKAADQCPGVTPLVTPCHPTSDSVSPNPSLTVHDNPSAALARDASRRRERKEADPDHGTAKRVRRAAGIARTSGNWSDEQVMRHVRHWTTEYGIGLETVLTVIAERRRAKPADQVFSAPWYFDQVFECMDRRGELPDDHDQPPHPDASEKTQDAPTAPPTASEPSAHPSPPEKAQRPPQGRPGAPAKASRPWHPSQGERRWDSAEIHALLAEAKASGNHRALRALKAAARAGRGPVREMEMVQ